MKNAATELGIILIGYFTLVPAIQVTLQGWLHLLAAIWGVCVWGGGPVISCKPLIGSMLLCQRSQMRAEEEDLTSSKFCPLTRPRMQATPSPR